MADLFQDMLQALNLLAHTMASKCQFLCDMSSLHADVLRQILLNHPLPGGRFWFMSNVRELWQIKLCDF